MTPEVRSEAFLVREVGDELVVYDQASHRAHRLNRAAALVWHRCHGRASLQEVGMLRKARCDGIVVREVEEELLVYDRGAHRTHRLNRSAALVRHCDGRTYSGRSGADAVREGSASRRSRGIEVGDGRYTWQKAGL